MSRKRQIPLLPSKERRADFGFTSTVRSYSTATAPKIAAVLAPAPAPYTSTVKAIAPVSPVQIPAVLAAPPPPVALGRVTANTIPGTLGLATSPLPPVALGRVSENTVPGMPGLVTPETMAPFLRPQPAPATPPTYNAPVSSPTYSPQPVSRTDGPSAYAEKLSRVREPVDPMQGQSGGGGGGYTPSPEPAYDTSLPADDGLGRTAPAQPTSTALVPVKSSAATIVPIEKPGLLVRIWRFFFGPPKAPVATVSAHGDFGGDPSNTQQAASASLVRRARAGDQNAMATLNLIRENAAKGEAKAVSMYDLLLAYCRQNPVDGTSSSAVDKAYVAAVRLSHGEPLSNSRIQDYAGTLSAGEEEAFVAGMYQRPSFGSDPKSRRANFMGRTVGIARRLQAVRMPESQVSNYDHACAWELGE